MVSKADEGNDNKIMSTDSSESNSSSDSYRNGNNDFNSEPSPTDKVREFRDAVVKWAEDHLAGMENRVPLVERLRNSAHSHLPNKWLNSARIAREIIRPSVLRWLEAVQVRFRQRYAPQLGVAEADLQWRAGELSDAVEECVFTTYIPGHSIAIN